MENGNSTEDGNPINHGSGNKRQPELDYMSGGSGNLYLQRTYNSKSTRNGRFGARWSSNYDRFVLTNSAFPNNAGVLRGDGKILTFTLTGGVYQPDPNVMDALTRQTDVSGNTAGWQYRVAADQSLENYDANGKLLSITSRDGKVQRLRYSDATTPATTAPQTGLLLNVTDQFGRQLNFTYDSKSRVIQITDPFGGTLGYGYDSNNNLAVVTHQDGTTRTYVYNEAIYTAGTDLPAALTGIIDENGARFATYNYDNNGLAISTEHAGGVEKYSIAYTQANSLSTVTDPLGTVRSYTFQMLANSIKATGKNQPGGAGCNAASSAITYDAIGNVSSRIDFNGNQTTYIYDTTRNLETSRVEGSGTPQARTITTSWHETYRLPVAVAEPNRITVFTYDSSGNLLNKTVRTTSDVTGEQGLSASAIGLAQVWTYTYNNIGQVLTTTDPLNHTITYSYYSATDTATPPTHTAGDLATVTDAVNHGTTFAQYDGDGRPLTITDFSASTTTFTYSPRGWLTSRSVASGGIVESTNYVYDGVGQLTKVTFPDASTLSFTYDPAHRLTSIADSLGNSIAYTLDNMGNRISGQLKDPSGTLARQTTRVYDALNRLQQITGNAQ
jgi:YD repeat-containing protein